MTRTTRRRDSASPNLIGGCGLDQGTEINGATIDDFLTDIVLQMSGLDQMLAPPVYVQPDEMRDSVVVLGTPDVKVS